MAFLTLGSIQNVVTREEALDLQITLLQSVGFNATSWQTGSVQRTFLEMSANLLVSITQLASSISALAFNSTSVGSALTAFSDSNYDNQRFTATNTVGNIEHTVISGSGPYVVVVGQLVVQDDTNGFTYRNITAGTLTDAAPVTLAYQAEETGSEKNVSVDTITTLNTPLAGVSVNNPSDLTIGVDSVAVGASGSNFTTAVAHGFAVNDFVVQSGFTEPTYNGTFIVTNIVSLTVYEVATITFVATDTGNTAIVGAGTWITTPAIDNEVDVDLRVRNTTRWATLTITRPSDAYNNIVRNSDAAITRSTVDGNNPRGPGTVDIYIAGPIGALGTSSRTTAQTAVDLQRPVTANPLVLLPTQAPTALTATIFITASEDSPDERAAIEAAAIDFINSQEIGGTDFGGGGVIPFAILSQTVTDFDSVVNITWAVPTADIAVAPNILVTVSAVTFTYTQV